MDCGCEWLLDLNCAVEYAKRCVCEHFRRWLRSVLYLSMVWSIYTRTGIKDDMCWVFAACALFVSSAHEALPSPPWLQIPEPCKHRNLYFASTVAGVSQGCSLLYLIVFCLLSAMKPWQEVNQWESKWHQWHVKWKWIVPIFFFFFQNKPVTQCVKQQFSDQVPNVQ